jgi:hypothetical protein
MKTFDVQTIEIHAAARKSFAYIADPRNLPRWASAFEAVSGNRARMATPQGAVDIELQVAADAERGTVDWTMIFPDGSVARAFSRVIALGDRTVYSFVLPPPPVPLEQLEGALDQQSRTLSEELACLRKILEQ